MNYFVSDKREIDAIKEHAKAIRAEGKKLKDAGLLPKKKKKRARQAKKASGGATGRGAPVTAKSGAKAKPSAKTV